MSAHDTDLMTRIELERADAARKALKDGIQDIENHNVRSEKYRKAFKRAVRILKERMAKL